MTDSLTTASGRLRLRRPAIGDVDTRFALHHDPETNRFNPLGPDRTRTETEVRVRGWITEWHRDGIGYHIVEQVDDGAVVGAAGLRCADGVEFGQPAEPLLNLYYRFVPATWGHGYAGEAAAATIEWGRIRCSTRPVVVVTKADNSPSLRVARTLGLTFYADVDCNGPSVQLRQPVSRRIGAVG